SVFQVVRVRNDLDHAALFEALEALDRRGEFHAVIRGVRFRAKDFALFISVTQDASPTAFSRVSQAGTICDQLNLFQASSTHSTVSAVANWSVKKPSTISRMCG